MDKNQIHFINFGFSKANSFQVSMPTQIRNKKSRNDLEGTTQEPDWRCWTCNYKANQVPGRIVRLKERMNEGGTVNDYPHIYIIITFLPSNITRRAEDYQIRNMREPVLIRGNYIASPMVPTKTRSDSTKALVRDLRTIFTGHWKFTSTDSPPLSSSKGKITDSRRWRCHHRNWKSRTANGEFEQFHFQSRSSILRVTSEVASRDIVIDTNDIHSNLQDDLGATTDDNRHNSLIRLK